MTRSTPTDYAVARAAGALRADVRPTPLADRFAASTAAPLTVWQREKLRQAMQQALLLAKWVTHR